MSDPEVKKLEARIAELETRLDALIASYENLLKNPKRGLQTNSKLTEAKRKTRHW
jgi:hypothetical protein